MKFQRHKFKSIFHLPWSEGIGIGDGIAYEAINTIIGVPIVITEKLDGSNVGITSDKIHGRSPNKPKLEPWNHNLHTDDGINLLKNMTSNGEYIFIENLYAIHSIKYVSLPRDWFVIMHVKDNMVLPWMKFTECVPELWIGSVNTAEELHATTDKLMESPSTFGGPKEGLVVRPVESFKFAHMDQYMFKFVRKDHIQTDEKWKKEWEKNHRYQNG